MEISLQKTMEIAMSLSKTEWTKQNQPRTKRWLRKQSTYSTILLFSIISHSALAATQTIDLTVAYKKVNFANKTVTAIAVNDQIRCHRFKRRHIDRMHQRIIRTMTIA